MQRRRSLIGSIARLFRSATNAVELEERYWDDYAIRWQQSPERSTAGSLGSEWNYADDFVTVLTRHASPPMEALEVGCGGGRITATAVSLVNHVHAADVSAPMLHCCKERCRAGNISFHKLDGVTLGGFQDASVDLVYSHDVFVQLSSIQVYPYLIEIRRVLRNGGTGVISAYDFKDSFQMFKQTSLKFWNARKSSGRRLHFMSEEMLRTMLEDLKLEVIDVHRGRFLTVAFRKTASV